MNKDFRIYILFLLFFTGAAFAFADDPSSALDDKPSVDNAADSPAVQVPSIPSQAATSSDTSYVYDLKKLIEKSRQNIKEVNEKIKEQAVLKRNQKREERAREYYEKGVELTNEGKLDEAREYFEKAIRITEHPEMAGYIRESQIRLRKQESALQTQEREHSHQIKADENARSQDVEEAYKEAVALYKLKKYHPAKDAFEHVDEIAPDYRATSSYLKIIDQDIILTDAMAVKQQAVEIERQQKEAEAARAKEKAMWLAQIEEKEKEHKEAIDKQAQDVYDEAVELYKIKKFAAAKKKFEEVSWVIPDYKLTMKYLGRIDRDAQIEQARVAQEQKKALEQQRWEEEVANKKKEALQAQEAKAKEIQHLKVLEEQARFMYAAAVNLYNNKAMDEALEKFTDIENTCPDFKSTRLYLAKIKQWQFDQQQRKAQETRRQEQEALERKKHQMEMELDGLYSVAVDDYKAQQYDKAKEEFLKINQQSPDYRSTQGYLDKISRIEGQKNREQDERLRQQQEAQQEDQEKQKRQFEMEVNDLYISALKHYRDNDLPEAQKEFLEVAAKMPGYEFTNNYLIKIAKALNVPLVLPQPVKVGPPAAILPEQPTPTPAIPQDTLEAQQEQAQDITVLAEQSAALYRQISGIADDSSTARTKKKMAQVDEILNNLREDKDRLLRQMQNEQWKKQHEQSQLKQEAYHDRAQKMYEDGLEYFRSHEYIKAKVKFLGLDAMVPDYKATRRYLDRIETELGKENADAVNDYQKAQADRLKQMQAKEVAEQAESLRKEHEEQQLQAQEEQSQLQGLAQKASDINDDIIRLSRQQDYAGMKEKFAELQNTVMALTALKEKMANRKESGEAERKLAIESANQQANMINVQQQQEKRTQAYEIKQAITETHAVAASPPPDVEKYKHREIMQEQNMLFSQAVDTFRKHEYSQAKLLFGELADQNDHRAEGWLKKVDRAIAREVLRSRQGEERERAEFILNQIKAQRQLAVIEERERQRQKQLTEELERQKHQYEDNLLLQERKEETMKAQEQEREVQEAKSLQAHKALEKQEEMYRFHTIPPVVEKPAAVVPAVKQPAKQPVLMALTPSVTSRQLKIDQNFSKKRKAFLDNQYKKQQQEKKLKEQQIMQAETQHREDMERQEQQAQAQLEARREAVRKQLEDGVEAMYQEALSLYKQGNYMAAAYKFKDVQDILPGYKNTQQYMDDARQKSLSIPSQPPAAAPDDSKDDVSKALDFFDPNAK